MTPAKHNRLAHMLFRPYIYHLFKKQFSTFHLYGTIPEVDRNIPLILIPNHSTWWDGIFIYFLNHVLFKRTFYIMMLEDQLQRYPFFARLGAYGIRPGVLSEVKTSLNYTIDILSDKTDHGVLVCIFPQGELLSWSHRPVVFKKGIDTIISRCQKRLTLLPLAMQTVFLQEQRAQVFFLFGQPEIIESNRFSGILSYAPILERLLDQVKSMTEQNLTGTVIYRGKQSIHRQILSLKEIIGINRNEKS
jgi:hypothetical protein